MKLRADIGPDGTVTVEKQCADGQHDMVDVTSVVEDLSDGAVHRFDVKVVFSECTRCGRQVVPAALSAQPPAKRGQ